MRPVVYESNKYKKTNSFSSIMELGLRLFWRDFSAKYRQSLFGLLWVVIVPLFTVGVFVVMNNSGILHVGDTGVPYIVYALYGLTIWNLFSGLVTSVAKTISEAGSLMTKINFPRISLVFSPIMVTLIDFIIRLILLLIVMLFMLGKFSILNCLFGVLFLAPLVLLGIGIGLFFTVIGAVFKDFPTLLGMFFNLLMFISPVIYPVANTAGIIGSIAKVNPLTYLLDVPRNVFFFGNYSGDIHFIIYSTMSVVLFILGLRFYNISLARIVERI